MLTFMSVLNVSRSGIEHALRRRGVTHKKTLRHPKADNDARTCFQAKILVHQKVDNPIVYIDESGFATDMPRTHGGSLKGLRSHGKHDWQTKGRTNVIGASQDNRLINTCLSDGHINRDVFYSWLTQELLPCMPPGAVIVMDNASFHKRQDIADAIRGEGHLCEYLPVYSPVLNHIEHKWAQAKASRRKQGCDVNTLFSTAVM